MSAFQRFVSQLIGKCPAVWTQRALRYLRTSPKKEIPGNSVVPNQILVDLSVIYRTDARTGIQRVVRSLYLQLVRTPPCGYLVRPVVATTTSAYKHVALNCLARTATVGDAIGKDVEITTGDIFLALDLSAHLLPRYLLTLLKWKAQGVKFCFLLHDILPITNPQWFTARACMHFKRWLKAVVLLADQVICVSECVKAEFTDLLTARYRVKVDDRVVCVIPLGCDFAYSFPTPQVESPAHPASCNALLRPFLLMVGTVEPRKGYDQALAAFDLLWQSGVAISLVIVGQTGWQSLATTRRIRSHAQYGRLLHWYEDAGDDALTELYQSAAGLLMASYGEGFGLPLVEAAAMGKPILARSIPIFHEIAGEYATFFYAERPEELYASIVEWLSVIGRVDEPKRSTLPLTTWVQSGEQFIAHLRWLCARGSA